ncbi:hypothetical protein BH23ACT9_BH23ACT9_25460 [soil metagenome]
MGGGLGWAALQRWVSSAPAISTEGDVLHLWTDPGNRAALRRDEVARVGPVGQVEDRVRRLTLGGQSFTLTVSREQRTSPIFQIGERMVDADLEEVRNAVAVWAAGGVVTDPLATRPFLFAGGPCSGQRDSQLGFSRSRCSSRSAMRSTGYRPGAGPVLRVTLGGGAATAALAIAVSMIRRAVSGAPALTVEGDALCIWTRPGQRVQLRRGDVRRVGRVVCSTSLLPFGPDRRILAISRNGRPDVILRERDLGAPFDAVRAGLLTWWNEGNDIDPPCRR